MSNRLYVPTKRKEVADTEYPLTSNTIFTFWEPQGRCPPYLQLCLRTWQKRLPGYTIALIDYTNLDAHIGRDCYDLAALKWLGFAMQKDALMVAVLRSHGGIFMDLDTLVVGDIAPAVGLLAETELVMFGYHMAFAAARPESHILARWAEGIRERLSRLQGTADVNWDYLGNAILDRVTLDMAAGYGPKLKLPFAALDRIWQQKKRVIAFRLGYRRYLHSLSPRSHGFIAEWQLAGSGNMDARDRYLKYWFTETGDPDRVLQHSPMVIGLHNSWTPDWYKELSAEQVLDHGCLLSKTLKRLLNA